MVDIAERGVAQEKPQQTPLLSVRGLEISVADGKDTHAAVADVSLQVRAGEAVGLVGESGSGKSLTAAAIMGILPAGVRVSAGSVEFGGRDLAALSAREMSAIRGEEIGFVFQDPGVALNPLMTLGAHIVEAIRQHRPLSRRAARAQAIEALAEVGIADPARRVDQYPHEFSGGMKQRAMIAIAIVNRPRLIIADEPTTALDVTIQAQILDLLRTIQKDSGAAMLLITHDLGVIAETVSRVAVMYSGRIVEEATVDAAFHSALHPYTRALVECLPTLDGDERLLPSIPGAPPTLGDRTTGCDFASRCPLNGGRAECEVRPELLRWSDDHLAACHFSNEMLLVGEGTR